MSPRLVSWWTLVAVAAVAFPLLGLWPLNGQFSADWYNHTWLAAYSGEHLRQHGSAPTVINTTQLIGMHYPVFYGTLFYPSLSLFTSWLSPSLVLRAVLVGVTWLEFSLVSKALIRVEVPRWLAGILACIVIWAIYPLTNLYHRSAITEYVATALLTCAVACWFLLLEETTPRGRRRLALGFCLLITFAAGTHPITALYSVSTLGLLAVAAYDRHRRSRAFWVDLGKALAAPMALALVVLAPWLYAVLRYQPYLRIGEPNSSFPWFYPESIDRWRTRFSPLPYDPRLGHGKLDAPFLDAQVNAPLLILLLAALLLIAWRERSLLRGSARAVGFGIASFVFFTWISLSPRAYDFLPSSARLIQIAYRAVTYQNLSLLVAILAFAAIRRSKVRSAPAMRRSFAAVAVTCLLLSGAAVVSKLFRASHVKHRLGPSELLASPDERRGRVSLSDKFYGLFDYSTASLYAPLSTEERSDGMREVNLPVGNGDDFGIPERLAVDLPRSMWIATNVQAFPWNHVVLDGNVIPDEQLRIDRFRFVVAIPAGSHTLEMLHAPDTAWLVLRGASFVTLVGWLAGLAYLSFRARLKHLA